MAIAFSAATGAAFAADPQRGEQLFFTPPFAGQLACADCHSDRPQINNFGNIWVGRNAPRFIAQAIQNNTGGMGVFNGRYGAREVADIAAWLGNTPARVEFAPTAAGAVSAPRRVQVATSTRDGLADVALGVEGELFSIQATSCTADVARFSVCEVDLVFRPPAGGAAGPRDGALTIAHAGTPTPVRIPLAGTVSAPPARVELLPARLDFGAVAPGASVPARALRLSAAGPAPLRVASVALEGAGFVVSGGDCRSTAVLAAGQSCILMLAPVPAPTGTGTGTGTLQARLVIGHDGEGGRSEANLMARVDAATPPLLQAEPAVLDFGAVATADTPPRRLRAWLHNPGRAAVVLADAAIAGSDFRLVGSACAAGGILAPGQRCELEIAFVPQRSGTRSGELRVAGSGGTSLLRLALTGTLGSSPPAAAAGPSAPAANSNGVWTDATALHFNGSAVGTAGAAQRLRVWNRGSAALAGLQAQLVGGAAAAFVFSSDCPQQLAAGADCSIEVRHRPAAAGRDDAALVLGTATLPSVAWIGLVGSAGEPAAAALPAASDGALVWTGATVATLAPAGVGLAATSGSFVLRNTAAGATAPLSFGLFGEAHGEFSIDSAASNCPGAALAPGATCTIVLRFAPRFAGPRRAWLAASDGSRLALGGTGQAPAQPAPVLAPAALVFDAERGAQALTLWLGNQGAAAAAIDEPTLLGAGFVRTDAGAGGCAAGAFVLAPGSGCALRVEWRGDASAAAGAELRATTGAASDGYAPASVALRVVEDPALRGNLGGGGLWSIGWCGLLGVASVLLHRRRPR